jgi:hypothetical protein
VTRGWLGHRRFGTSSTASSCRGKTPGLRSEGAHKGEEEREAREGVRAAPPRRYRRFSAAEITNSGEEFLSNGDVSHSDSRGRWERGSRGLIGKGSKGLRRY